MKDTSDEMRRKQYEIIMAFPLEERVRMACEMIEFSFQMAENLIKQKNPHITEGELRIEIFKAFYEKDFSAEEVARISEAIRAYHAKNTSTSVSFI